MIDFIPLYQYAQILYGVGQWRAISMKCLFEELDTKISYSAFCRNVRKLENYKYLKSTKGKKGQKFLVLTSLGSKFTCFDAFYDDTHSGMFHDLVATRVLKTLKKEPIFVGAYCTAGIQTSTKSPDGEITFVKSEDKRHTLAIEIELTQKSKSRIREKFGYYVNYCNDYEHAIYVFNKRSTFESYKNVLAECHDERNRALDKISLLLDENLTASDFNPFDSEYFFKGRTTKLFDVFKEEKEELELIPDNEDQGTSCSNEVQTTDTHTSNLVQNTSGQFSPRRFFARI